MDSKTTKTVKRAAAGTVAAVSLLVNTAIADPEVLLGSGKEPAQDPSHVCVVDGIEERRYILETEQDEPFTLRERICLRVQSLPLPGVAQIAAHSRILPRCSASALS